MEVLDVENLRPHYARTLWDWSDALEARLDAARTVLTERSDNARAERVVRAYRLYLAGSAMSFEKGWIALHQVLASRPASDNGSVYPFRRDYMYQQAAA
jgi:cyclopropane-fatty-acyl-phospholipid synthase